MPAAASSGILQLGDQCGGRGGNCNSFTCLDGSYPGQTCPSGSSCQRQSELVQLLWWQTTSWPIIVVPRWLCAGAAPLLLICWLQQSVV